METAQQKLSIMVKSSRCEPPSATSGMWGVKGRDPLAQSQSAKGAGKPGFLVVK